MARRIGHFDMQGCLAPRSVRFEVVDGGSFAECPSHRYGSCYTVPECVIGCLVAGFWAGWVGIR